MCSSCTAIWQMAVYWQMHELRSVILRKPASQPGADRQLSALSRSVASATAISAPPQTFHTSQDLIWSKKYWRGALKGKLEDPPPPSLQIWFTHGDHLDNWYWHHHLFLLPLCPTPPSRCGCFAQQRWRERGWGGVGVLPLMLKQQLGNSSGSNKDSTTLLWLMPACAPTRLLQAYLVRPYGH